MSYPQVEAMNDSCLFPRDEWHESYMGVVDILLQEYNELGFIQEHNLVFRTVETLFHLIVVLFLCCSFICVVKLLSNLFVDAFYNISLKSSVIVTMDFTMSNRKYKAPDARMTING